MSNLESKQSLWTTVVKVGTPIGGVVGTIATIMSFFPGVTSYLPFPKPTVQSTSIIPITEINSTQSQQQPVYHSQQNFQNSPKNNEITVNPNKRRRNMFDYNQTFTIIKN